MLGSCTKPQLFQAVRQLLAKAQRSGAKWGEAQWSALWQDLEGAQRAVPALLEPDELLAEYCRWGGWGRGELAGCKMAAGGQCCSSHNAAGTQACQHAAVSAKPFGPGSSSRSPRAANHCRRTLLHGGRYALAATYLPRLPTSRSETLVVLAAREILDSAPALDAREVLEAKRCLELVPESELAGAELALMSALGQLQRLGLALLPAEVSGLLQAALTLPGCCSAHSAES